MEFGQLHHVEYYVHDLDKTIAFWGWFLGEMGYSEYQRWPTGISWAHRNGTYLVFVQTEGPAREVRNNRQADGLNHICLKGKSPEHLRLLADGVCERGGRILTRGEDRLCFEESNLFAVEVFL